LKTTLFQKWQRMIAPPETQRPPSKRRKRKSSATNAGNTGGTGKKKNNAANMSPGPPNFSLASQDVMVVGEPSLMGGEFGDEDERLITRLENHQYDPSASAAANGLEEGEEFNPLGGPGNGPNGPPSWSTGGPGSSGPPQAHPSSGNGPSGSAAGPDRSGSNGPGSGQEESKKQSPNMRD